MDEFLDEINSEESRSIMERLENIDSETDNFDITFVKMADARYARKWGVTNLPAIVYFRRRFPSIYRGDLHSEKDVLEWLRKNRSITHIFLKLHDYQRFVTDIDNLNSTYSCTPSWQSV